MNAGSSRNRLVWTSGLLVLALALIAVPMLLRPGHEFVGTDDRAVGVIVGMGAAIRPWVHPIWQPASANLENWLFGLQAALGLALLTVCFLALRRRQQG